MTSSKMKIRRWPTALTFPLPTREELVHFFRFSRAGRRLPIAPVWALLVGALLVGALAGPEPQARAQASQPDIPCNAQTPPGRISLDAKGQAWICAELKDPDGKVTGYQWLRLTKNRRRTGLVNLLANLYIDVQNEDNQQGRQLVIEPKKNSSWQQWTWGGPDANTITVQSDGYCMGVAGGSANKGGHIVQWQCNGHRDQSWYAVYVNPDDTSSNPEVRLVNANSWMCAGVIGNSTHAGAYLVQWPCDSSHDKIWLGA